MKNTNNTKRNKKNIKATLTSIPEAASDLESTNNPHANLSSTNNSTTNLEDKKMQKEMSEFYKVGEDFNQSTLGDSKNIKEQEDLSKATIFNSKIIENNENLNKTKLLSKLTTSEIFETNPQTTSPNQEVQKTNSILSWVKNQAKNLLNKKGQGR